MLLFWLFNKFLDWLCTIDCGYVEVPIVITKGMPEYYGYDSNNLDDVMEYYEQKRCGYLD